VSEALDRLQREHHKPVIVSTHPRTQSRMKSFGVAVGNDQVRFMQPFGFPDFIALEREARCVLSDSGTVQEECAIFHVPNVTLRDVTERPETLECGSNVLAGAEPERILACVALVLSRKPDWNPPREYLIEDVSDTVVRITLSHHETLA